MRNTIKIFEALPFEEGKTYKTKFATGEHFTVTRIIRNQKDVVVQLFGIYEKAPHIGECPLYPERLIPEKIEKGVQEVCSKCGEQI